MPVATVVGLLGVSLAWAQTPGTAEKELVNLENEWKQAVVRRNADPPQRLYGDEYTTTDQEGLVWTKAEDMEIDTSAAV